MHTDRKRTGYTQKAREIEAKIRPWVGGWLVKQGTCCSWVNLEKQWGLMQKLGGEKVQKCNSVLFEERLCCGDRATIYCTLRYWIDIVQVFFWHVTCHIFPARGVWKLGSDIVTLGLLAANECVWKRQWIPCQSQEKADKCQCMPKTVANVINKVLKCHPVHSSVSW